MSLRVEKQMEMERFHKLKRQDLTWMLNTKDWLNIIL